MIKSFKQWLNFYRVVRFVKKLSQESKPDHFIDTSNDGMSVLKWYRGPYTISITKKEGVTTYAIAQGDRQEQRSKHTGFRSSDQVIFRAEDAGWVKGTSGEMEEDLDVNQIIIGMLS